MSHEHDMASNPAVPPIKVRIESGTAEKSEYAFVQPFRCGRDQSCEIQLADTAVSRFHAEFWFADGKWWILDLQSANGTFVDGRSVERGSIETLARVQLGEEGLQSSPRHCRPDLLWPRRI